MPCRVALLCAWLCACGDDARRIVVDLRTDLAAGYEATGIVIELDGDPRLERVIGPEHDLFDPAFRVGDIEVGDGVYALRAVLRRVDGGSLERRLVVAVDGADEGVTVTLTRSCVGVACPGSDDDPGDVACLGGACVPEDCIDGRQTSCDAERRCETEADCDAPLAMCARAACIDGFCIPEPDSTRCAAGGYCSVERGCASIGAEPSDGGIDAALADAGVDAPIADAPIADAPIADASIVDVSIDDGVSLDAEHADASLMDAPFDTTLLDAPSLVDTGLDASVGPDAGGWTADSISELEAGDGFTCARVVREVFCWGDATSGRLGNGEGAGVFSTPQPVSGLMSAVALDCGSRHCCVVTQAQSLRCWGANESGQAMPGGASAVLVPSIPFSIGALETMELVAAGDAHTCAVASTFTPVRFGGVTCWGSNATLQLGRQGTTSTPEYVMGVSTVMSIAAGADHTCVQAGFGVSCWGNNDVNQLTSAVSAMPHSMPSTVAGAGQVASLKGGGGFTVALSPSRSVAHWGNVPGASAATLQPAGINDAVHISAGARHACAARSGGQAMCWGDNAFMQARGVAGGTVVAPAQIAGLTEVVNVAAGTDHSCALTEAGEVWCWGNNDRGQLGNARTGSASGPERVVAPLHPPSVGL